MPNQLRRNQTYVCPDIPSVSEYRNARIQLGKTLQKMAIELGYGSPEAFGRKIAEIMDPPREHVPFSPAIVQDWFDGKLVPESPVMMALDEIYEGTLDLEDAYEVAAFKPLEIQSLFARSLLEAIENRSNTKLTLKQWSADIAAGSDRLSAASIYTMLRGSKPCNQELGKIVADYLTSADWPKHEAIKLSRTYDALYQLQRTPDFNVDATELSQAMLHVRQQLPINNIELVKLLAKEGFGTQQPDGSIAPSNSKSLSAYFSGSSSAPFVLIRALERVAATAGIQATPSLQMLYDQKLREAASKVWHHGLETHCWGELLRACRLRMGINSMNQMGEILAEHLGRPRPFDATSVLAWERGEDIPSQKYLRDPNPVFQAYLDIVSAFEANQSAQQSASQQATAEPWFEDTKKQQFGKVMAAAVANHNRVYEDGTSNYHCAPLSLHQPEVPNPKVMAQTIQCSSLPTDRSVEGYRQHKAMWRVNQPSSPAQLGFMTL